MVGWEPLVAVCALLASGEAPRPNPHLEQARAQLRRLEEKEALATLDAAKRWPHNSSAELAQVQKLFALAYAGLGDWDKVDASFKLARMLDPKLELSEDVAPRVRASWQAAAPPAKDAPVVDAAPGRSGPGAPPKLAAETKVDGPAPASVEVKTRWNRWAAGAAGAAGVAAAGVGVYFGAQSSAQADFAKREPRIDAASRYHAQAVTQADTANAFFLGAGAAALTSVVLWLLPLD